MFRERTFRFNGVILATFMSVAALLGMRVLVGVRNLDGLGPYNPRLDTILVAVLVACCFALRFLFVVQVGPDGLRTTDGVGRYHEVPWDAMRRVRNILGFLWVPHGTLGSALCFPIFLDHSAAFRDYVVAHAPEGNPLRAYLMRA